MNQIALEVRRRRIAASASQAELGIAVGRSQWWISSLEKGNVRLGRENASRIFAAIDKLASLKRERQEQYSDFFKDVRLPSRVAMINRKTSVL